MVSEKSSPSRVAGTVIREVSLGGETYTLSQPDRVRKAADEEALIIARRVTSALSAVGQAMAEMPAQERAEWRSSFTQALIVGIASPEEWSNYYRSRWFDAFRFWSALDPKHKTEPDNDKRERNVLDGTRWVYELMHRKEVTSDELELAAIAVKAVSQELEVSS